MRLPDCGATAMARQVGVHTALSLNWALSCQLSDSPFASVIAPICAMAAMAHPAKRARTASTVPQVLKAEALAITTFHLADPSCHTQLKELSSFKPEFCHQLFGEDEEIKGYKDPTIDIWLNPVSFSCYVDFRHKGKAVLADDVLGKLREAFVSGFTQDPTEFLGWLKEQAALDDDECGKPVTARAATLEVRHSKLVEASSKLKALHARMEPLLLFFVDGASHIDPEEAAWDLLVARKLVNGQPTVVGFCTLYTFWAYPDRSRLRVSQVLTLPLYQRQGVAQGLLQAAYDLADLRGVLDVTYEEPTEAIQTIRERLEVQRMLRCAWLRELAAVRAATLYSSQHAWAGDKLVPAEAKSALRSASEAASEAQELADTGPVPVPVSTSNGGDSDRELQEARALALASAEVQRAHHELRIPPSRVRAGWEALLARQPDMRESRKVADALRALVKSRLQGAEGAQAAVLGKRTIDRPHGNFVMLKLGVLSQEGQPPAMEDPADEAEEVDAESALEDQVGARMNALQRLAALPA